MPQLDESQVRRDPVTGTYWPRVGGSDEANGIEWTLRYGVPSRSDLLLAAEIVAAYDVLIHGRQPRESLARARRALKGDAS